MYSNLFVSNVKHSNDHHKLSFLIQTLLPLPVLHIPYIEDFPVQRTCARLLCSCVSFVRVDYTRTLMPWISCLERVEITSQIIHPVRTEKALPCAVTLNVLWNSLYGYYVAFVSLADFNSKNELQFCDVRLTKETEIILTGTDSMTSSTGSFRIIVGIKCNVHIKHCLATTARFVET